MNWLLQKRKVRKLEQQLVSAASVQRQHRYLVQEQARRTLARPQAQIWAFCCGLLLGLSDHSKPGAMGEIRRGLSSFSRAILFLTRVTGLRP